MRSFSFQSPVVRRRLIFVFLAACLFCLPTISSAQIKTPDTAAPAATYRIRQGDKLSVKFFYQPELNEVSLIVRPDGFIGLQMIDDVQVAGLTVTELKKKLERQYAEILLKPEISVTMLEFVAPRVYIGGQVGKPGRYDLRDGQTLVQVIFLAGGFTADANRKMAIRARPDSKGEWQIETANVMKILTQKDDEKDLPLEDGDYIFIPDSKISQVSKAVERFRGLIPRFF